jgi:hypothetical protein
MKLINKIFKDPGEDISGILTDLERIRTHSDLVNCVFRGTGSSWLGVNIAGRSMFPNATFELPQYYSNPVLTEDQLSEIASRIASLGFSTFLFHGYVPYFKQLITVLKEMSRDIRILCIYHGFASEMSGNSSQVTLFQDLGELVKSRTIDKIGLVKAGHEQLFSQLFGINASLLYNKVPVYDRQIKHDVEGNIHIGVLVNETFRKNMHVQVMAALLTPSAIVHVLNSQELGYLNAETRIVQHGMMPHFEFLALLASMDINLHITYSESFGGQVFTESLGYGIPCLTGYSNGFLDFDAELKALLSVREADDPMAIHERITAILSYKHLLAGRLTGYCRMMNNKAEEILYQFIHE